jgi:hypothetical protein
MTIVEKINFVFKFDIFSTLKIKDLDTAWLQENYN